MLVLFSVYLLIFKKIGVGSRQLAVGEGSANSAYRELKTVFVLNSEKQNHIK